MLIRDLLGMIIFVLSGVMFLIAVGIGAAGGPYDAAMILLGMIATFILGRSSHHASVASKTRSIPQPPRKTNLDVFG